MADRVYGVTPPISLALPTEPERHQNELLVQELHSQHSFENPAMTKQRETILKALEKVADAFVKEAAREKHPKHEKLIRDARGRVFTYGSYRLGVYSPGSDIDTLVVAPKYVTVDDFFAIFPRLLVEMAPAGAIQDLTPVKEAYVPIIKFEYSAISIDLIFCAIQTLHQLPHEKTWSLADNTLLRGLDERAVRSLNGTRVTDEILNLVPEPATFKLALRAIKMWAQKKAIYANILGYPGGVAWAMLVARVCQLYPKATGALVVDKFFNIMLKWPWPLPVLLKEIEYGINITQANVWNPRAHSSLDKYHKMPVITPSYPSMCATHNVGDSALQVIKQELAKGARLTHEIMVGRRPWKDLFTKHTFFTSGFKYYLTVTAGSRTRDSYNIWVGFIESRVRHLVISLERHADVQLARPYNKGIERMHKCKDETELDHVHNGSLRFQFHPTEEEKEEIAKAEAADAHAAETQPPATPEAATANGDRQDEPGRAKVGDGPEIAPATGPDAATNGSAKKDGDAKTKPEEAPRDAQPQQEGKASKPIVVYTTNFYIGLQLPEKAKALDLSREVNDFRNRCWNGFDKLDEKHMFLSIQHIKNISLPDDVFESGEVRPTKVVKKKRAAPDDAAASQPAAKRHQAAAAAC